MADNGLLPALSNDDVRRILGMEPEEPKRTIGGTLKDVGVTLGNAAIGAGESVVGLGNLATFGGLGKAMNAAGYDPKAARKFLSQYYSDAQKKANKEVEDAQGFWDTAGAMLRNPSTIAATAVESAPSMYLGGGIGGKLLGAATGRLAKAAEAGSKSAAKYFERNAAGQLLRDRSGQLMLSEAGRKALGRRYAAVGEGAIAGGALAEQMRQEDPNKEFQAKHALYGGLGGAITGGIGRLGSGVANRMGVTDVDTLLTTGLRGAAQEGGKRLTAGQIAKGIGAGALQEGVFEELPQSMQEEVWSNLAAGRPWNENIGKAGAQGMMAGFVMGAGANARAGMPGAQREILEAQAAQERARMDALGRSLYARPDDVPSTQAGLDAMQAARNAEAAARAAGAQARLGYSGVVGKALAAASNGAPTSAADSAFATLPTTLPTPGDSALEAQGDERTRRQRVGEYLGERRDRRAAQPETDAQRIAREQAELELARNTPWGETVARAEAELAQARQTATTRDEIRRAEDNLRMVVGLSRPHWGEQEEERLRQMDALAAAGQRQEQLWGERVPQRLANLRGELGRRVEQQQAEEQHAKDHGLVYTGDTTIPANALVRGDRVQVRDAQGRPDIARVRGTTDDGRIILQDGVRMTFGEDEDVPIQALSLDEHAGRQRQGWGFKTKEEREQLKQQRHQLRAALGQVDVLPRAEQELQARHEQWQARQAQAQARQQARDNALQAARDSEAAARAAARAPYTVEQRPPARALGAPSSEMDAALAFMPDDLPTPGDSAIEARDRTPRMRQAEAEHDARMQQPAPPPKPETKKERREREAKELERALQVATPLARDRVVKAQEKLKEAKAEKDADLIQAAENRLRAAVANALKSAPETPTQEAPDHDLVERQYYVRRLSDAARGWIGYQAQKGLEGLLADAREAAPARRQARRKAKAEARAPYIEQEMRERGRQWQEREQAQQDAANEQTRQANRAAGQQWMEERAASGDLGPADGVTRANRAPTDEMESLMGHRSTPAMDQAEQAGAANQAKQRADTLMQQALQSPMSKAVKAARKELTAVKKTKDQTAIQRAEEHLARVVSNAVQARQQRLAVEQRKAQERMDRAQAAHDEKEARYAAEQLRQVQEQRTALAQVLTNIAQGKPGDLARALTGLAQQRIRQREGNAIQMPGPQTPALLPYLPQETTEPEEPPIQRQAENNFPRRKKSGNAAKAGTASKTGVEGNRGADEFMFNSEGAPMLGYRPGNAGQNATARAENVATGTRKNTGGRNRKPGKTSGIAGKSERSMVTEEREGQPMPAPQAAPAKQEAPKQIEYKPQPTYPGEAVIPQGQQGGFGFRPKGQRQAQALLPLLPPQETRTPQERGTPPAYPGRPQAPALPRNEQTTEATQERQAPAMPRRNPSLQRAMQKRRALGQGQTPPVPPEMSKQEFGEHLKEVYRQTLLGSGISGFKRLAKGPDGKMYAIRPSENKALPFVAVVSVKTGERQYDRTEVGYATMNEAIKALTDYAYSQEQDAASTSYGTAYGTNADAAAEQVVAKRRADRAARQQRETPTRQEGPAQEEFIETLRDTGEVVNALGDTFRLVEVKSKPGTFRVVAIRGDNDQQVNITNRGMSREGAARKAWEVSANVETSVDFNGFVQRQYAAERQKNDRQIRQKRVQRKLAESKERLRQVAAAKERDARIKAIKDRIQSLPFPHREPGESLKEYKDRRQALARAQREELARAYGLDTSTMDATRAAEQAVARRGLMKSALGVATDYQGIARQADVVNNAQAFLEEQRRLNAEQSTAENTTAEQNGTLSARKWTKPGASTFSTGNPYWSVTFNDSEDDAGYSDGHIIFFGFTPDNVTAAHQLPKAAEPMNTHMSAPDENGAIEGGYGSTRQGTIRFNFAVPLTYRGNIVTDKRADDTAVFERADNETAVTIGDQYLNAIMYYAQKRHGKNADVRFLQAEEENADKRNAAPIVVLVNGEPFALIMPRSNKESVAELLDRAQYRRRAREADAEEEAQERQEMERNLVEVLEKQKQTFSEDEKAKQRAVIDDYGRNFDPAPVASVKDLGTPRGGIDKDSAAYAILPDGSVCMATGHGLFFADSGEPQQMENLAPVVYGKMDMKKGRDVFASLYLVTFGKDKDGRIIFNMHDVKERQRPSDVFEIDDLFNPKSVPIKFSDEPVKPLALQQIVPVESDPKDKTGYYIFVDQNGETTLLGRGTINAFVPMARRVKPKSIQFYSVGPNGQMVAALFDGKLAAIMMAVKPNAQGELSQHIEENRELGQAGKLDALFKDAVVPEKTKKASAAPESTVPPQTPSKGKRETETENLPGWAKDAGYTIRKAESGEGFEVYRDTERLDGLSGTYEEALERVEGLTAVGFFFVKGKAKNDGGKRRIVYKIGFKDKRNGALRDDQFLDTPEFASTHEARVYLLNHLPELWERRAEKLKANNRTAQAEEPAEQKPASGVTQENFLAVLDYSRLVINSVGTTYVVQPMASRTGAYHVFAITKDGRREQLNKKGLSREEAKQLAWETSEEERTGRREIAKDVRPLGWDEIGEAPVGTELQRGKQVYRKLKLGQWGRKGPKGAWLPLDYMGNLGQETEWERRNPKEAARTRDPQHLQRTAYEQRYVILSRLLESEQEKLQGWGLPRLREYQNSKEYFVQQLKYVGYAPISENSDIILKRNDDGGFTLRRRDYLTVEEYNQSGRGGRERYTDIGTYATMDDAVNAAVEQVPRFAETTEQAGTETGAETSSEPLTPAEVEEIKSHINNMWRRKATFTGKDGVSYTVKEQRLSGIDISKTGFLYTVTAKTANGKESKPAYSDTKAKAVTIVVGMINDNLKAAREQAGAETTATEDATNPEARVTVIEAEFDRRFGNELWAQDGKVRAALGKAVRHFAQVPSLRKLANSDEQNARLDFNKALSHELYSMTYSYTIGGKTIINHDYFPLFEATNEEIEFRQWVRDVAFTAVAGNRTQAGAETREPAPKTEKEEKGIADKLGEHIGGSRADMAQKTGPRGGVKTAGKLPEWAKGYSLRQVEAEYALYYKGKDLRGRFATVEQAVEYLRARVAAEHFFVTRSNKDRLYKIAARNTRNGRRGYFLDTPGFEDGNEANRYLLEHLPELMETRDGRNKQRRGPRQKGFGEADLATAETSERVGKERRAGDATPDDFMSAFGFRGVEFGLWNNQKERQALLNDAYDALMDLADLLGIPPRALSLNGELALAFGARGRGGKARAHYEPDKVVINLTKTSGKGTLAHEWLHALDYYFGGRGERKGPMSEHYRRTPPENVRPEVFEAFKKVMSAIVSGPEGGRTKYYQAAIRFRNSDYWANRKELLARAFSAYIEDTLEERGEKSSFLSYGSTNALYGEEWADKPFPEGEERQAINRAFSEFFDTLEVDDSEGRAALYSKTDRAVPPEERANIEGELREALGRGKADSLLGDKGSVRIIETQEEARELAGRDNPTVKRAGNGTIQGFYLNGVAYLVRDGIAKGNVMGVLMHEYGEHAARLGFRDNVGYRAILKSLERRQNENSETGRAIQAAMQRAKNAGLNENHKDFWSEVAAYIVEANANIKTSTLDRVTNFFKKWLFKVSGLGADNFTHKDLVMFARAAVKAGSGTTRARTRRESFLYSFAQTLGVSPEQLQAEYDAVVAQYKDTPQWLMTPDGKKRSNLNERQWVLVRTPRFKNWFGDWENDPANASKVVDANGEPLVVYHGTPGGEFTVFQPGAFFTDDYMNADGYASGETVFEVFLNLRNPLVVDAQGRKWDDLETPYGTSTREIVASEETAKHDGVIFRNINDSWIDDEDAGEVGTVYWVPKSNQIKSAADNTGAFDPNENDILLSVAAAPSAPAAPAANPAANNTVTGQSFVDRILANAKPKYQDMWERFIYNFIDNNDPRERVWKKAGSPTDQDFVTVERLRGKKAAAEQKKFREEMVTPLLKTLAQGKLAVSDLEEYAYAMHTPERNRKMREVNAKRNLDALRRLMPKADAQDLQDRIDFVRTVGKANGWTQSDIQNAYLGMMEEVFNDIPRRETMLAQAQANLTANSSQNARAHVQKMQRDLDETKAIRDRWRRESVRFAGQTDQEAQATIQKWQRDGRFRALQNAHNQLEAITAATLDVLHESGYLSDEEFQEIKNGYQHYVPLHRDGFLDTTPIKLMQVAKGSMRDVVNILPNVVRSHETAVNRKHKAAAGRALYDFAEANPDAGISIEEMEMKPTHDQEGNIVMYRSQAEPEDGIFVRVNGKKYLLRFAASSKTAEGRTLLRFLDAVKGSDRQMNSMVRALHWVTRKLAMVNTSLSPEFMVTNFARDLQTAFVHLNQKDIDMPGLQKAVAHDVFPAMRGIWAAERGDKTSVMAKWYADFQANGGKVGWMQGYEEAETLAKDLQKELKLYQPGNHGRKAFDKIKRMVEHGNAAIENCMRLATYKNLVERGVSKDKAARIASGLTVDFTQHGKMGPQINALYMFWNASVQGSVRMIQALASSKKVQAIAGGIASAGFLLQMLALAGGGDDDSGEPYILGIPDAIRERNIIIMLPGGDGKYIKIPKAYGYGALYDFGAEVANSLYMGAQGRKYNHYAGAMRVVNSLANSFNPIQSATMLQTLAPTLLDPVAYVAENKTWAGTPLMPEQNPYGPSKPDAERFWKGTSPVFKKLSKTLNEMTGGDAYKGGWADISPETFSMVWDNATGGMGRFIGNTLALPFSVAAGDTEAHKIPFARTVYGEWNDRAISSRYYEAMDRAEIAHMRFKNAESLPERKRLYREPDHKLYLQSRKAEAQIKQWRKRQQQLEAAGNKDGAERIRTRIVAAQSKVLAGMPN